MEARAIKHSKIQVRTLTDKILTFTVKTYEIEEGDIVVFIDERTGRNLKFHASNCEIETFYEEEDAQ